MVPPVLFYLCTSYCVEVTETQTGNKHNVTLKVGQNELTGNINLAIIVSLKCDKKKDVKKKGDKSEETVHGLQCCQKQKKMILKLHECKKDICFGIAIR